MGHVMIEILNSQPKNSAKVYDPKVLEFKGYCESLYGRPPESHFITVEKKFGFLYYQSYMPKKRKRSKQSGGFDRKDLDEGMRAPKSIAAQGNVIGAVMVNQYFCATRRRLIHSASWALFI